MQDDTQFDSQHDGVTRRDLFRIGNLLAMPVLIGASERVAGAAAGPLKPGPEIYQSIGVEPVINCRGTFTIIGGSVERPEVRAAMDAAAAAASELLVSTVTETGASIFRRSMARSTPSWISWPNELFW